MQLRLLFSLASGPLFAAADLTAWQTPTGRNDSTLLYGRLRVPTDCFDESLRHPNATGRSEFVGRDLSGAYQHEEYEPEEYEPEDDDDRDDRNDGVLLDGWSLRLNLTNVTNISLEREICNNEPDTSTFAGLGLSVLAPEGMLSVGNSSSSPRRKVKRDDDDDGDDRDGEDLNPAAWKVCATVYGMIPTNSTNYTQVAQDDGGTCRSYLSDDCREALREATEESFEANRTCQYKTIPDACLEQDNTPGSPDWHAFENATIQLEPRHFRDGKSFFTYGAKPRMQPEEDDPWAYQSTEEEWNDVARMAYAVLFTWGYDYDRTDGGVDGIGKRDGDEGGKSATSLVCVSASDFADGVPVPDNTPVEEENPDSASPAALYERGRAALALFAALAAAFAVSA